MKFSLRWLMSQDPIIGHFHKGWSSYRRADGIMCITYHRPHYPRRGYEHRDTFITNLITGRIEAVPMAVVQFVPSGEKA